MNLTAIILTYNEEQHLQRCISNIKNVVDDVVVVDCFSTDATVDIAKAHEARILQHEWTNHATQFNWALEQIDATADWILRIDADEYLTDVLKEEIKGQLAKFDSEIVGVMCNRRMTFQGRLIRHGGVFPIQVLRIFRRGRGRCENRWMDEHIKVAGETAAFKGEIIDDNLQPLTWWTAKHNSYASREAVDMLNLKYGFMPHDSVAGLRGRSQAGIKRWFKESVYARLPGGFRAFVYFFYRYVIRLGFLDGSSGTAFHFLQGFWYRYLVDAKIAEVERYISDHKCEPVEAIDIVLGINLEPGETAPQP